MKVVNAAPMMRSNSGSSSAGVTAGADRFFVFGKDSSCVGTISYLTWYDSVPQEPSPRMVQTGIKSDQGGSVMIADRQKSDGKAERSLDRRDVLAIAGAAAAVGLAASPALAQSQPASPATAPAQGPAKPP